ncbi:MAG: ribosome small subunit-dependent GTPase A [Vulcanimicrobiaceae bacterium]
MAGDHDAVPLCRATAAFLRVSDLCRALVVAVGKNSAWLSLDGVGGLVLASLRRSLGKRSMPVPGDRLWVRPLQGGGVVIERLEARESSIERRTPEGRSKTMAANVDTLVVVSSFADPPVRTLTLDQLVAFAALHEVEPVIVFTKPDLAAGDQERVLVDLYRGLGYQVLVINPKRGENVEALRLLLAGRAALLVGPSGVGKSSIFRALGGEAVVGELSRRGLGRATTSTARLYRGTDGFLIDSPGVADFGLGPLACAQLAGAFVDLASRRCRFRDCRHLEEPDCEVRRAVDGGQIAQSRYDSYCKLLVESP